jgi:UDP-N-acetylmuramate dehydrogenase
MADLLTGIQLAEPAGLRFVEAQELKLAYRHSELPEGAVITRVRLRFRSGDPASNDAQIREDMGYRRRTQPWELPNLGSTFRNPEGDFAGRLLEATGLKGARVGQVAFSTVHANFLTNLGGGRAADAHRLIDSARSRVRDARGINLSLEVALAGEF